MLLSMKMGKITLMSTLKYLTQMEVLCLDTLGYSAKDIEIITPEQYEAEFGGDEDG